MFTVAYIAAAHIAKRLSIDVAIQHWKSIKDGSLSLAANDDVHSAI